MTSACENIFITCFYELTVPSLTNSMFHLLGCQHLQLYSSLFFHTDVSLLDVGGKVV